MTSENQSRRMAAALHRRFEALVFDWDGTAVPDRASDATQVGLLVEELCALGMHIGVVSGTHVENIDDQLRARPNGPGSLVFAVNRGSEVFAVDRAGPHLVERREATPDEDAALDRAATETVHALELRGLHADVVSTRLNRRKIDLIPEPEWNDPPKAIIDRLLEAVNARLDAAGIHGLSEVVTISEQTANAAGLAHPRVTSDVKHVEIGLTDKRDSAQWLFDFLGFHGIGAGSVLIAGDEFGAVGGVPGSDSWMLIPDAARATVISVGVEPEGVPRRVLHVGGGPDRFVSLLTDQLARRRRGEVPSVDEDPAWTLVFEGLNPQRERPTKALLTLPDGRLGSRGSAFVARTVTKPVVLMAGLYDGSGSQTHLLACPTWEHVVSVRGTNVGLRRVLDLRTGVLHESRASATATWHSARFSSLAQPGSVALRADCPPGTPGPFVSLVAPPNHEPSDTGNDGDATMWMQIAAREGGVVAAASQRSRPQDAGVDVLERLGAYVADPNALPDRQLALDRLHELEAAGYETLLGEHRRAWAHRWRDADVTIAGDEPLQLAVRFALRHVLAAAAEDGDAAVGARGLSGSRYGGHVFWDAELFVLPVLAATNPAAARAMLEYRIQRLPAARAAAAAEGRRGARFPWESAGHGDDVTPQHVRDPAGRRVAVETGPREVHIVGCVAWAVAHYLDWTDDRAFAAGPGGGLLVETARYWASRLEIDTDGSAHLRNVIGPDEYHVDVDDNAFTNILARWNLRAAAKLEHPDIDDGERSDWLALAAAIVDGFDSSTDRYEQFAGFFELEPLVIADLAPHRPIDADVLLGAARVAGAQIVKQADVLMAHHILPDELAPGSLMPDVDYYEPRTSHGSTLSPGIHASLLARVGRLDDAVAMLDIATRIDLDDLIDQTAGGLHLAAMGSVWQALAFGFVGLCVTGDTLAIDPVLPDAWSQLEMRFRYRGTRITTRVEAERLTVFADHPQRVVVAGHAAIADTKGITFERSGAIWRDGTRDDH